VICFSSTIHHISKALGCSESTHALWLKAYLWQDSSLQAVPLQ